MLFEYKKRAADVSDVLPVEIFALECITDSDFGSGYLARALK